jgi:hypothetical protein
MYLPFCGCLSVGGFKYALVLVDRAMRYYWIFGLKSLGSKSILSALRLFRASAGGLARCVYCACDAKPFGTAISAYLIYNDSNVVATPATRQSSNGLVESAWKVLVSIALADLRAQQMPRYFCSYAITHAVRMFPTIPGKYDDDHLAPPFMLVHGVGHDVRT